LKDAHIKSIGKKGTTVTALETQLPGANENPSAGQGRSAEGGGGLIERFDSDGDGKISPQELPEAMRDNFMERRDKNKDGFIDKEEAASGGERGRRQGGGGPGGDR
jgi:hypothetical protein